MVVFKCTLVWPSCVTKIQFIVQDPENLLSIQHRSKTKHEGPTGCAKSSSLCVFVVVLVIRLKSHMMNPPPEAESKSRAAPGDHVYNSD